MSEPTTTTTTTANVLTVPVNDDGTIGALPELLQRKLDSSIAEAVRRARAKPEPSPVEAEELRQAKARLAEIEREKAERKGEYEKALKMREDDHAAEMAKAKAELERRTLRLREAAKADIRAAAAEHGARKESLAELEVLLSQRLTLDDETLTMRVLGEDGKPSDLTVSALVKGYLDANQHHRAAPTGGGGARGGASYSGMVTDAVVAELATVKARIAAGSRSADDINRHQELSTQLRQRG